jgi:rhodanese-related sulfurtransferase
MVALLVIALAVAVGVCGCGGGGFALPVGTESAAQVWQEATSTSKPTIVDVRAADVYAAFHVPYAVNWPGGVPPPGSSYAKIVAVGTDDADGAAGEEAMQGAATTIVRLFGGMAGWAYGLDLSDTTVHDRMVAGAQWTMIDVRNATDFAAAHVPGSINLPLDQIDTWAPTLNPYGEYLMICQLGVRSATARDNLARRGFTRVHGLIGGMDAWHYDTGCG